MAVLRLAEVTNGELSLAATAKTPSFQASGFGLVADLFTALHEFTERLK